MNVRKILIPVAAGLLFSPALMAADIDTPTTSRDVSDEYLDTANATDLVTGNVLAVVLGSEYAVDDVITLDVSGAALVPGSLNNTVSVLEAGTFKGITLGLLSSNDSQAVYRVTGLTASVATDTTIGLTVEIAANGDLDFLAVPLDAAGVITVTFSAKTNSGLDLDTGGGNARSTDYITVSTQYTSTVATALDGVVDVNFNREKFVSGAVDVFEVANASAASTLTATFDSADYVLTGDFGWVFDDDDMTAGIQPVGATFALSAGCTGLVVTATDVSFSCAGVDGDGTLTIDTAENLDPADGTTLATLPKTAFSVSVDINFDGFGNGASPEATQSVLAAAAAGAWVLNGYQALIPYMPYGSGISQVIYLANRGTQAGDVTVEWIDGNGDSGSLGVIANLGAGTTLSIGPLIKAALPAAQTNDGRLALTVTANVPAGDVQINSQYNVLGNRAFTLHEDNRP